ncbi:hypothetical protein [Streptomyces sp. NPDC127066]|uniref:hypothetical protein n=1 Tax=Streptomyces sp. NPDC127066 TaxID=3347125 RepID=UPI003656CD30
MQIRSGQLRHFRQRSTIGVCLAGRNWRRVASPSGAVRQSYDETSEFADSGSCLALNLLPNRSYAQA